MTGQPATFEYYSPALARHYQISAYQVGHGRFATVFRDISEQVAAEAALQESKRSLQDQTRLLSTILDGIPDIIALQKPDHTILQYNRAGYKLLGLTPEECHGRKCYELVNRGARCDLCASNNAQKTGQIETIEKHLPDRNVWIEARSIPVLDDQGNVMLIVEQLHDITHQKKVEEELISANTELEQYVDALESSNRALEEFNSLAEAATRPRASSWPT